MRRRRSVCVNFDLGEEADAHFRLRVAPRHQLCEPIETLLCPIVKDAGPQHFYILFVYVDGFLLERKRLLVEGLLEIFQLCRAQIGGLLRLQERVSEVRVGLGYVVRGSCRHIGDFVVHQLTHALDSGVHPLFLLLQADLERLFQLHDHEILVEPFCQDQR